MSHSNVKASYSAMYSNMISQSRLSRAPLTGRKRCNRWCLGLHRHWKANGLLILTTLGIMLGFAVGFSVRSFNPSQDTLNWIGLPGEVFISMLKMMTVPFIIFSIISRSASLTSHLTGKISMVAFSYAFLTNILACLISLIFCVAIKPGRGVFLTDHQEQTEMYQIHDIFADLIRNVFPGNLVEAAFSQAHTQYKASTMEHFVNTLNGTLHFNTSSVVKALGKSESTNLLGLIVISTFLGVATNSRGSKGKAFLKFFTSASGIVHVILRWMRWFSPVGVCSLIVVSLTEVINLQTRFSQLAMLIGTVTVAVAVHLLLLMIVLYAIIRHNPCVFLLNLAHACMIGFASCSTMVAIPDTIDACEVKNKIDRRVTRLVIPFYTAVNADGSAIYIAASAIFIASVTSSGPTIGMVFLIAILSAVTSIAIPKAPSASIVALVIILTSLGIPTKGIGLLFALEWYLDRIRTVCNVISNSVGAAVTYHFCRRDLHTRTSEVSERMNLINGDLDEAVHTVAI